jgi:gliding motility-associated-like protein
VTLTTVDAAGESFTYTETYAAREQVDLDSLLIPNVMTPNGDGINDVFTPGDGPNLGPCAELSIFDRYGRKVYENLGNDLSWDGRSPAGEACIPAVYVYVLVVNAQEFTGHLTLFR